MDSEDGISSSLSISHSDRMLAIEVGDAFKLAFAISQSQRVSIAGADITIFESSIPKHAVCYQDSTVVTQSHKRWRACRASTHQEK